MMQAGDMELNPGPQFPCLVCHEECDWSRYAVQCDPCDGWYHTDCMIMNTITYKALEDSNVSWICCRSGLPSFSSSLFISKKYVAIQQLLVCWILWMNVRNCHPQLPNLHQKLSTWEIRNISMLVKNLTKNMKKQTKPKVIIGTLLKSWSSIFKVCGVRQLSWLCTLITTNLISL